MKISKSELDEGGFVHLCNIPIQMTTGYIHAELWQNYLGVYRYFDRATGKEYDGLA